MCMPVLPFGQGQLALKPCTQPEAFERVELQLASVHAAPTPAHKHNQNARKPVALSHM
jgi:hypothetical protein